MRLLWTLAILLGMATFSAGLILLGTWFSWLEFSSEAYAFSQAKFAEIWQDHLWGFKLFGAIAVISGLGCVACVCFARNRGP